MSRPTYSLTIALNVLNFLGPNLYSNIPAVLSELVANAWDADATEVYIDVDVENDQILIKDNGSGMFIDDMNSKYLRVGYQKRGDRENNWTPSGRHFMGRKGIGKLAIFSFAEVMEIQSCKEGQKAGCIMNWKDISDEISNNNYIYNPRPLPLEHIGVNQGTQILLTQLYKDKFTQSISTLRKALARRFTVIGEEHNFSVIFNGEPISEKDRTYYDQIEFIWYLGNESRKYVDKCKNVLRSVRVDGDVEVGGEYYKASGWVATVAKPSDIKVDQNNTIALFAHGKLIQEDILVDFQEAQAFAEYIVGDINVDFMDSDEDEDIVTADRQRLNQNDPRYQAIKKYIKEKLLRDISSRWDLWRLERGAANAFQMDEIKTWYERLNKTNQRKAARLFDKVTALTVNKREEKQNLYLMCVKAFDALKNVKGIPSMEDQVFIDLVLSKQPASPKQYDFSTEVEESATQPSDQNAFPENGEASDEAENDQNEGSDNTANGNEQGESATQQTSHDTQTDSDSYTRSSPPPREIDEAFKNLRQLVRNSSIEQEFKTTALNDLREAYKVYRSEGYKACVVMFGAVLEGLMLAVLRKSEVLDVLRNDCTKYAGKVRVPGGLRHSDYLDNLKLADALAEHLTFENYRQIIEELIPEIESLRVEGIQHFRNAIHPWKVIKEPHIYGNYDFTRTMSHLAALKILANQILSWKP